MSTKLKEIILMDGEQIQFQIEGNAYTESPNPLIKIFAAIIRIIGKLFGWSLRTYIIVTNKRILRIDKEKLFWVVPRNTSVLTLPKTSIREVGYAEAVRWLIFKTLYFRIQTFTENTAIAYKGSLDEINKIVIRISDLITE